MTAQLCCRFGEEPKAPKRNASNAAVEKNIGRMQRWFPDWRRDLLLLKILKISNYRIRIEDLVLTLVLQGGKSDNIAVFGQRGPPPENPETYTGEKKNLS